MAASTLRFERRFALLGALVTCAEVLVVGAPLGVFLHFHRLSDAQRDLVARTAPVVLGGAWLIWWLSLRWWRGPLDRAVRARRAQRPPEPDSLPLAARVTRTLPRRAGLLRAALTVAATLALGSLLVLRDSLRPIELLPVAAITLVHGLAVQLFRVLAWSWLLARVRGALVPDADPLLELHHAYRTRLARAGLATSTLGASVIGLFVLVFLRPNLEGFVQLETFCPLLLAPLVGLWVLVVRRLTAPIERYLAAATGDDDAQPRRDDPRGLHAYRRAQALPYQLGAAKLGLALAFELGLALVATYLFDIDREYVVPVFSEALIVSVGAALYDVLWHRVTLRPLLAHLATRHRPSPDDVRTPFGLRTRMLLFLGVLTLFAGTLSLLASFVQYMTLATSFLEKESELRRDRVLAELRTRAATAPRPLETTEVEEVLAVEARRDKALLYFLPDGASEAIALGGDTAAPPLPPAQLALLSRREAGQMVVPSLRLTGTYARVRLEQAGRPSNLGALAVLYPGYWGRGLSFDPQVTVLLFFFALLLVASMGIVVLVAADLTGPVRKLEERAAAMAAGDLNRPVVHVAGEVDEVGRLTFALEGMRRALNEKLRSSTEINLSLEAEVTRRTAELERRNQELAGALDALRRAQAELVRSEKMASMGRLVAGIAHEINNPVNAIVNTVGPLDRAIEEILGDEPGGAALPAHTLELRSDAREMIRVIRSGARRTKEIVQALHNYSRGDDDSLVEVNLHRGIDESLDLLRHHLRHGIAVERDYAASLRVLGNPGQLQQVFMNILANAAQAIGAREGDASRGGTIRISTAREGDRVVIRIRDDGAGIPDKVLPRIFDPFFTTKDVGQGSGLGLSIVHGIVERHGGSIAVESEVGRGTTFTVTLPAGDAIPTFARA